MKGLLATFLIGIFLAALPAQVFAVEVDRATIEKYSYVCGLNGELCSPATDVGGGQDLTRLDIL